MNKLKMAHLILGLGALFLLTDHTFSETLDRFGFQSSNTGEDFFDLNDEDESEFGSKFRWDYIEEDIPWSQWVEGFLDFEENDEDLEEITPMLLQLERWYLLPRDLNSLTADELENFFWLSPREREEIFSYRKQRPFTTIEELYQKNILSPESYELIQPFIRIKKSPTTTSPTQAKISYGIALKAKDLKKIKDSIEVLKNYQLKLFGEIQVPNFMDIHYLAERDPNETKIFDLVKWSWTLHWPLSPENSSQPLQGLQTSRISSLDRDRLTFIFGALKINIHQSLLMATGYSSRKNEQAPYTVKKNSSRIRGDKSVQEIFLKGQALDIHYGSWRWASWVGSYRYDDTLHTNVNSNQIYAQSYSFYPTLHRPFPDFSLTENVFGFLLEKKLDYHTLSLALLHSRFTYPILTSEPDKFYGRSHWGLSWGWDLDFNRYRWYGESVLLFNEKRGDLWKNEKDDLDPNYRTSGALVTGARIFFPESDFFLSFRFIPPSYQAVHNLTYTRYSSGNDELGLLGGFRLQPLPRLNWVTSFDFFKKVSEEPEKFGIDLSELVSYRHASGYYQESQIRLRERGEWEDDNNHFWEVKHRSGWKHPSGLIYGEVKASGYFIEELIDSPNPLGLLLALHGEYHYQQLSTTVMEILWSQKGPRTLYDLVYYNRFFNDTLYLSKNTLFLFLRQEFRPHPLLNTGFSLGFYWDDSEGKLFHTPHPTRVMFSFYLSGSY